MQPATPVYEPAEDMWGVKEIVFAKDDPDYLPLPALRFQDGVVVTRWHMTWRERLSVLLSGDVYLSILTDDGRPQPTKLSTTGLDACGVTASAR